MKNQDIYIIKEDGTKEVMDVPIKGSLGLLALGAVGIKAWKEKRREEFLKQKEEGKAKEQNK